MSGVGWREAAELSYRAPCALERESVPLASGAGRVLASGVRARVDLPHFDSSAMDGWAVAGEAPWELREEPGRGETMELGAGEAVPIVTGGLVPGGTLGILRSENGEVERSGGARYLVRNLRARADEPTRGKHIRRAGEEARTGDLLIDVGTPLGPAHLALAAIAGHDRLEVTRRPRVSVVTTGDEVVTAGIPSPGWVRDTFGPALPAVLSGLGCEVVGVHRMADRLDALVEALAPPSGAGDDVSERPADLVVTTGGTGTSRSDHLRHALEVVGARVLIPGLAVRPGGPSVLAELGENRFLLGLPGNPLAALTAFALLGAPLVRALSGAPEPRTGRVRTATDLAGVPGRSVLIPYRLTDAGGAVPARWRGSAMLRGLAEASGILVCPEGGLREGEPAETLALPW